MCLTVRVVLSMFVVVATSIPPWLVGLCHYVLITHIPRLHTLKHRVRGLDLIPLFTRLPRSRILGSPYPRSCIASPLSGRGRAYCLARALEGAHKMWGCGLIMRLDASPKIQNCVRYAFVR